jgi:hypothetical protein
MAKGEQKGNRESKKPKKEKIKTIAAAPSVCTENLSSGVAVMKSAQDGA